MVNTLNSLVLNDNVTHSLRWYVNIKEYNDTASVLTENAPFAPRPLPISPHLIMTAGNIEVPIARLAANNKLAA
jgi:hypothetical protein